MRRAAKVDANHKKIVASLRKVGYSVLNTHQLKNAFDILVGHKGRNYAFEIKDGDKPPSARKLTEGEQKFYDTWNGQIDVIYTAEQAIEIIEGAKKN